LAELFKNLPPNPHPRRRYVLARIDGKLVLRVPEIEAAIERAIDDAVGRVPRRQLIELE
jgi:hypothetical protein